MNAVQRVIRPKQTVTVAKNRRGPTMRTSIVEGSWNIMLLTVKMKIDTEKRSPVSPRSCGIDVTAADEMIPLSRRLRLHSRPAIVQSRRSTLRLIRFSTSDGLSKFCSCDFEVSSPGAYISNWAALNAYQANNITGQWKRATVAAACSACNGLGGIAGSYIVRSIEAPSYVTAIWVSIGSHMLIIFIVSACTTLFWRANREQRVGKVIEGVVGFRYTY